MNKRYLPALGLLFFAASTKIDQEKPEMASLGQKAAPKESTFFNPEQLGYIDLGNAGATEISAFDPAI